MKWEDKVRKWKQTKIVKWNFIWKEKEKKKEKKKELKLKRIKYKKKMILEKVDIIIIY